jgi:hypothetical protein
VLPGAPDPMSAARDDLARRAEARCPGWDIGHHLRGWTATRTRDHRTVEATSLPGLLALVSVAGPAAPAAPPGTAH